MHGLQLARVSYIVYIIRTSGTEYRRICYNYPWMFVYVVCDNGKGKRWVCVRQEGIRWQSKVEQLQQQIEKNRELEK